MYNVDTLSHRTKIIAKVELLGIGVCEVERLNLEVKNLEAELEGWELQNSLVFETVTRHDCNNYYRS